jgi:hypothetical protein
MITKPTIYTEEFVINELGNMVTELLENKDFYLLGDLFQTRPYHANRYSEWAVKFKDNPQISGTIKRIKDILEYRLNKKGLEGKLNSTLTIFNLKNNYNWKDRTEQELSGPDGGPIETTTPEETLRRFAFMLRNKEEANQGG